jgi:hypothetical protein
MEELWLPIEMAPKDAERIELWIPEADIHRPGFSVFGEWFDDRHSKNPRPYWTNDVAKLLGVTYARTRQPTHWRRASRGPQYMRARE